ncbi:MAG TPA: hypothetical protein DHW82_03120 [Spirochaetia bacterium]|nr:MAG: hypothetical protein A2Y41_04020 [Spirochaetes bacterium GWB1_36_13]HCL55983.1 hypothetical protein [Spirochaetia bacterium]
MKKTVLFKLIFLGAWLFSGCGGSSYYAKSDMASQRAYPSVQQQEMVQQRVMAEDNVGSSERNLNESNSPVKYTSKDGYVKKGSEKGEKKEEPKLIYTANLSIQVRDVKEAQTEIIRIMESNKGFIDFQSQTKMVIRVPSDNLDPTLKEMMKIGVVLNKSISTYDVSNRYFDIQQRLDIAEKAKQRLLDILSKVKDVKEKVRIIEEIQRLTKEIESYKSILNSLDSYINYSLIEIYLYVPTQSDIETQVSPFVWINRLTYESFTLDKIENKAFSINLPSEFLVFDQEPYFIARNPKGAFVRIGKTANYPRGDTTFWKKALDRGMEFKNYVKIKEGKKGEMAYSLFEYKTLNPFYYLVGLTVKKDRLIVLEGFFPDKESMEKNIDTLTQAFENFEVKE